MPETNTTKAKEAMRGLLRKVAKMLRKTKTVFDEEEAEGGGTGFETDFPSSSVVECCDEEGNCVKFDGEEGAATANLITTITARSVKVALR
jgi:hypothetical protein